jgi:hypothetical protein
VVNGEQRRPGRQGRGKRHRSSLRFDRRRGYRCWSWSRLRLRCGRWRLWPDRRRHGSERWAKVLAELPAGAQKNDYQSGANDANDPFPGARPARLPHQVNLKPRHPVAASTGPNRGDRDFRASALQRVSFIRHGFAPAALIKVRMIPGIHPTTAIKKRLQSPRRNRPDGYSVPAARTDGAVFPIRPFICLVPLPSPIASETLYSGLPGFEPPSLADRKGIWTGKNTA